MATGPCPVAPVARGSCEGASMAHPRRYPSLVLAVSTLAFFCALAAPLRAADPPGLIVQGPARILAEPPRVERPAEPRVEPRVEPRTEYRAESPAGTSAASLSLREALALALARNPELSAFSQEIRATEAAVMQAGALPNPTVELGSDNLNNARKAEAGDRSTSLQIGQLFELGGKRAARLRLAETGHELARWDYEAKRADVLALVARRFVDVLAAQGRTALAGESTGLAAQVVDAVAKRVLAGRVSPVEETKARLALASAEIEREQARRELLAARNALGALWADTDPQFGPAAGDLAQLEVLPPVASLVARVRNNPDLARWGSEIARRQAGLRVEHAKAVPDVTVSAGMTRFSLFEDRAYTLGVAIPIPLFDRNRGGILEASRRLDKAADERQAVEVRLLAELSQTYQGLRAIEQELQTLGATLLPGAQSAFDASTRGYQLGRFGFLYVLDAQRTLFQSRTQHLRALADYQRGLSDIERLLGGPLQTPPANLQRP